MKRTLCLTLTFVVALAPAWGLAKGKVSAKQCDKSCNDGRKFCELGCKETFRKEDAKVEALCMKDCAEAHKDCQKECKNAKR